ncbi:MAG: hypothetical protein K2J32_14120 [Ruminococcus sp.]|nr:hypothetical protein [Ruminococcus sp.]
MSKLSFRYCPVCGGELDTGYAKFPQPYGIFDKIQATGLYYSDKTTVKAFIAHTLGEKNPAGYCEKCNRIFAEFYVIGGETLPTYDMDYYNESADNLYDDKIVSYHDDSDEKYNTIGGYTILTENKKFNKSED